MRWLSLLLLANCWHAPSSQPHAPSRTLRREASLAIEAGAPGRLAIDRDGVAWLAQCDGAQLRVRPWQGGDARVIGPCDYTDAGRREIDDYLYDLSPIAIGEQTVAIVLAKSHELSVTSPRGNRRYALTEYVRDVSLAIDGDAVVVLARGIAPGSKIGDTSLGDALAAIVRIEGDRITVHPLVRHGSTGPQVAPRFAAMGKTRMLLVAETGNTMSCDYRGTCGKQRLPDGRNANVDGALPLADGGMIVMDFEHSVSRLAPDGQRVWTAKLGAYELIGASEHEVWVQTFNDDPTREGFPIAALSLASGERHGTPAIARVQKRDRHGRYLEITGVAVTPAGTVVRGTFGGSLSTGSQRIETKVSGALCWWENPHDGDEYEIDLDESCSGRHRKAVLTARAAFVAINPPALRQRDD